VGGGLGKGIELEKGLDWRRKVERRKGGIFGIKGKRRGYGGWAWEGKLREGESSFTIAIDGSEHL
jgi:hypothetical protein